jgi:hypothetical protein
MGLVEARIYIFISGKKVPSLDARGQNRVIVTIITASPRAFQQCIGLGGVDKALVRLEDYYSAETAVWQPHPSQSSPLSPRNVENYYWGALLRGAAPEPVRGPKIDIRYM